MYRLIARTKHDPHDMIVSPLSSIESLRYADYLSPPHNLSNGRFESFLKKSDTELYDTLWYDLFNVLTWASTLKKVAWDMVRHFMNGRGGDFTSSELNSYILFDVYFRRWVDYVIKTVIAPVMRGSSNSTVYDLYNGEIRIPPFAFGHNLKGYKDYDIFDAGDNTVSKLQGLPILIDQVWAATVEADNIKTYSSGGFSADMRFTLYDDFGLDRLDLENHCHDILPPGAGAGFIAWYVLQHYRIGHKPFVTKIVIEQHVDVSSHY